MHVLSRQELFEMAWERPLTKVAADLGVTSTALKKTCRRHNIPTPSRGYWAAVAAGGVFPRPKLSAVSREDLESIRIVGAAPMSPAVKEAAQAARARMAAPKPSPASEAAVQAQPSPAAAPVSGQTRPELVATAKTVARAKVRPGAMASLSGPGVVPMTLTPALGTRAVAWLGQLLAAGEGQGAQLEATEGGARLVIDGERIGFRLEEKEERTPHVPTPKELEEKARRDSWRTLLSDPWPKYDYSPSGQLALIIEPGRHSNLRRTYADGRTQTLESMTGEILVGFAAHAAFLRERRLAEEDAARRAAEAEARRQRIAAYQQREERRVAFTDLIAAKLTERDKLVRVLSHVEAAEVGAMPGGMGAWLRRRMAEIDALIGAKFLEISASHAKVDFDEVAAAGKPLESAWSYPREVRLELWSIDDDAGRATTVSALEWTVEQGLAPAADDPVQERN